MIDKRSGHGSVRMCNKRFVIGGNDNNTCEVFDSISRKFTSIKKIEVTNTVGLSVVGIDNEMFAFHKLHSSGIKYFHIYDVLKDQWCVKEIDLNDVHCVICCSKLSVL